MNLRFVAFFVFAIALFVNVEDLWLRVLKYKMLCGGQHINVRYTAWTRWEKCGRLMSRNDQDFCTAMLRTTNNHLNLLFSWIGGAGPYWPNVEFFIQLGGLSMLDSKCLVRNKFCECFWLFRTLEFSYSSTGRDKSEATSDNQTQ